MPQINRIRVNNVKYNFGTQFYDDFLMRFSGKNTIYDLANGGGKSVLMLLLLQNMIPNCTLDDKQPIEKLFRTGSGSNTIHSLVEWNLSDVHIKNNYKYMLTGFCARKARDEEKARGDSAALDYFNYVIFYREYNDNDIKNLPLSVPGKNGEKERITYQGLKNYLRELEKKDFSLEIKIFDKKGDYQRFIAEYGIYESEWEIIRGINKTEGHVRTYFESNYKTTRKVVEDLLIEEIIEKSFKNRAAGSEGAETHDSRMAETLLDIKDQLLALAARKDDIHHYDRQVELLEKFGGQVLKMKELYFGQENLERELAGGYVSLKKLLASEEEKKQSLDAQLQELAQKKIEVRRECETVKVQESGERAETLNQELLMLAGKEVRLETELAEQKSRLTLAESMNDYLDYLYYKKERDIVRETIARAAAGKGELLAELEGLAAEKKGRDERLLAQLEEKLAVAGEKAENEAGTVRELESALERLTKELAVAEYKHAESEKKAAGYNQKIADLKQSAELVMIYDFEKEQEQCRAEKEELTEACRENQEKLEKLRERRRVSEECLLSAKEEREELLCELDEIIGRRAELSEYEERLEKLKTVYKESDTETLCRLLLEKLQDAEEERKGIGKEIAEIESYIEGIKKGCPVGTSKEAEKVLKYLERYHPGTAISGGNFLQEVSKEQRRELLERVPVLPFGVVVKKDFYAVAGDTGINGLNLGDYAVPVLSGEAVLDGSYLTAGEMTYAMCRPELFYDEKAADGEKNRAERELNELKNSQNLLADHVSEYEKDSTFLKEFTGQYQEIIEQLEEEAERLKLEIRRREVLIQQTEEDRKQQDREEKELSAEWERLEQELAAQSRRNDVLTEIKSYAAAAGEAEQEGRLAAEEHRRAEQELSNIAGRIDAWKIKAEADRKTAQRLKVSAETLKADWEKYRRYYKEETDTKKYKDLSDEELESRFFGAVQALQGGNSDIADKQKLLDNYETAMEKSLQAIDYKGVPVSEIEKRQQNGLNFETTKEELMSRKKQMEEKNQELNVLKKEMRTVRSEKDRLEGAVLHGKEAIIQKYGVFEKIDLNRESADEFIRQKQQIMTVMDGRIEEIQGRRKEMESAGKSSEMLLHDMERILPADILTACEEEVFPEGENLFGRVEKSLVKFERFEKKLQEKREEYEQDKSALTDELRLIGCVSLADEITANLAMPGSVEETDQQKQALEETISCLKLEKGRIEKSIQDMERIKENFESQCIQSCVNIRAELEKLPKLSRIVMDEKSIPIISLQIPYVDETEYGARMSEYIDSTVEQADALSSEAERMKFIRGRLSWKRLFSVIVTDMNDIRLNLYKRERMKEQSRYLRYEEAVGSTGQSQGIYIQFLIAVINYIASIHSRDADSTSLRKVIFIDNPFGAAKDIYIWEPIFTMLRKNNVQLIVPCRGATPAITGRFDVNYVLGQKLVNGKQQTVVVDYYSSVDSEKLDYTTMTYEQETLEKFL